MAIMGRCNHFISALLGGMALTLLVHGQDQLGFISIDCGSPADFSYTEPRTGINYISDATFTDTGISKNISTELNKDDYPQQLWTLRSFPDGIRNCYRIDVTQGVKYLIRATFLYGNYDGQDNFTEFDLYLGPNMWDTVKITDASYNVSKELIHVSTLNYIHVCLVNTNLGTPFISAIELRQLKSKAYVTYSGSLALLARTDYGSQIDGVIRYEDDNYDRIWVPDNSYERIFTSLYFDALSNKYYQPPYVVMSTAATPKTDSSPLNFKWVSETATSEYYIYMHFAEVEQLDANQSRSFNITINGELFYGSFVPEYLSRGTLYTALPLTIAKNYEVSIFKTENSTLPPILNAVEIYSVKNLSQSETDQQDVDAITKIKLTYGVNKNWQGDPCVPQAYLWEGLKCRYDGYNSPRIISLDLSSSGSTGEISADISNLVMLQDLDLSYNQLTGNIPQFLAQLPNLKTLNLSGNKFNGSVPEALIQKSRDGSLILSLGEMSDPDKPTNSRDGDQPAMWRTNKWWMWLIVVVGGIIIAFLCLLCYAKVKKHIAEGERKKKQKMLLQELRGNAISSTVHDKVKKRNNDRQDSHELQIFSFETISAATRNFSTKNKLGEGGFGPVYKGELYDGQKIAIKRLSRSSRQGLVEFKNEAILIAKLQHTNLVRLLGLCIQQEEKILIYEYMPNKSLDFFLFDSTKKSLLNWNERFNIIEGITQGLLYLHKYSRLRVIHRDLKASNILLDEDMNPKISDFGLARIFGLKGLEENTNRIVGTYGYMSPEYAMNGVVSIKTDVFSYGVLLLEIVSSKKNNSCYHSEYPLNLIGYAWQLWNEGKGLELIDPTIIGESFPSSEILRCIHVGLLCVQDQATDRPTMLDVATMLSSETAQLLPPKQPAYLINIVQEKSLEVSEIKPENCSINDVTISEMKAR